MTNNSKNLEVEDICPDCRGLLILKEDVKVASSNNKLIDLAAIYICAKCKSKWIRHHQERYILRY